jgi:hypothetical protein
MAGLRAMRPTDFSMSRIQRQIIGSPVEAEEDRMNGQLLASRELPHRGPGARGFR